MINLCNIYKIYKKGKVSVLNDINFFVSKGEYVSIVGHSGSGKTTMMNILGLLDTPSSGAYILDGINTEQLSANEQAELRNEKIGFIFQNFNLIDSLTAVENVELPLMFRGIDKKERRVLAKQALEQVDLSERMLHRPSELSGGQQQRVAIARAIVGKPEIILADEPTGNLDKTSAMQVMDIIEDLNQSGKTIVLITHDKQVAGMAHRIVDMERIH